MKEPSFWHVRDLRSRAAAPMTRMMLTPIAALYAWAGADRIRTTTPFKADIPVICIGNLTVGGTGKTPVVQSLRATLTEKGYRAASLSRGYKGELNGPLEVDTSLHTARDVGDEPLMLAASGEAWIGADREAAARLMQSAGVDVILMDDGHQNPTLHKDLSIVVIDGGNPCGNGFVFPKGPLREPIATGLARADGVIIMGKLAHPLPELADLSIPVIETAVTPRGPAPDGPLVAFAGIGRPQKFFDTLTQAGAVLADAVPFPDHHTFSEADIKYLRTLVSERNARLITTEKDFVRLTEAQRDGVLTFPIHIDLSQSYIDALLAPVLKQLP